MEPPLGFPYHERAGGGCCSAHRTLMYLAEFLLDFYKVCKGILTQNSVRNTEEVLQQFTRGKHQLKFKASHGRYSGERHE